MPDLLKVLDDKNLHVHEIPKDSADIYRNHKSNGLGLGMSCAIDTHFIMDGEKVVYIGANGYPLECFVNRYLATNGDNNE